MSKKNEINVDELINSQGGSKKQETKESKNKNASQTGWDDDEVESGGAGFLGSDTKKDKKKGKKDQKKENSAATWGSGKETQPAEEKVEVPQQPEKKRGIMTKPGTKPSKPDVVVNGFDFPELGQEAPPKEKEETKQEQPKPVTGSGITSTVSAPVRFQNSNKKTTGESFAKIEPVVEKEPPKLEQKNVSEPVKTESQPVITRGFRRETNPQPEEKPVEDTGKIKFGGEGPVRFSKSAVTSSKPREETKTEAEILREQREREIDEKLQKEKEEAQRQAEERKKRDTANPNHKHGDGKPFHKKHDNQHPEEETKQENHKEKQHSEKKEERETKNENHENKSPTKFNNSKKNQQAPPKEQPKVEVATPVVNETKEPETQETKEVVTKASTASWDVGLKKKSNKN